MGGWDTTLVGEVSVKVTKYAFREAFRGPLQRHRHINIIDVSSASYSRPFKRET